MKRFLIFFISFLVLASPTLFCEAEFKREKLNLLLISVDTLRADYLSCYGGKDVQTRNMDSLAKMGILFKKALAHNPLTLPSHINILTGVTPLFHGVHENLGFRLSEDVLTLAEYLKKYNYQTAAFIGSFPLDSRFGLAQGFDVYDDFYGEKKSPGFFFFVERKAEEVISRTIEWLKMEQKKLWFVFVHLFDPHQPYSPPSSYLEKYAHNLYAGEVAYVDDCLGQLFDYLEKSQVMERTLIVFTSDHGESLGEHGEMTHGYFAYNSTLHVPLIFSSRKFQKLGKVIEEKVSHVDLFPTICDFFGLKKPSSLEGQSLLPLIEEEKFEAKPIYFESLSAYYNRNWAPLRGIIKNDHKYIDLPLPELYNLQDDFKEEKNLASIVDTKPYQKSLSLLLSQSRKTETAVLKKESREAVEAMKSLGYLSGSLEPKKKIFSASDDLKSLLPFHSKLTEAASFFNQGDAGKALQILEDLISRKKDFTTAYEYLANVYSEIGNKAKAIEALEAGLSFSPSHAQMRGKLGIFLSEVNQQERAIKEIKEALDLNPEDAEFWNYLGVAYWKSGQLDKAEECYHRALALDQNYASALNNLGSLSLSRKNPEKALAYFEQAIRFDPHLSSAYNGKGAAFGMKGNLGEAIENWKKAVSYDPKYQMALYNLGLALLRVNKQKEALAYLEKYLEVTPTGDPDREKIVELVNYLKRHD